MTDNEIIKAMQCVMGNDISCSECTYQNALPFPSCRNMCAKNALDLINRQKAEIKRLNMDNKEINILSNMQEKNIREQQVIIDTLRILNKSDKSKAIKEFAERLKKDFGVADCIVSIDNDDIDDLVKEMTEVSE